MIVLHMLHDTNKNMLALDFYTVPRFLWRLMESIILPAKTGAAMILPTLKKSISPQIYS
jgi:hypothetical protein